MKFSTWVMSALKIFWILHFQGFFVLFCFRQGIYNVHSPVVLLRYYSHGLIGRKKNLPKNVADCSNFKTC